MITIVDYGVGNLASIANMLKRVGAAATITSDPHAIENADQLILPGVGAFDAGMKNLAERRLIEPLTRAVMERRVPVMGLCLGVQLMTRRSAEGNLAGLGWIDAETVRFRFDDPALKVPHMGWNTMRFVHDSPLQKDFEPDARFYFVHSFHLVCNDPRDVLGVTNYGYEFVSGVARDNIWGVQFHPEKSHRFGMQLLTNFAGLSATVPA